MQGQAKIFGHAIHPMLVVFPLGLLATSLAFDVAYMATGDPTFSAVAFWMIAAGVCGGLLAAIFGFIDWWSIPGATRAKAVGAWHGVGNLVVVLVFIASWFLRLESGFNTAAFTLSVIGVALALIAGWLGGELVERLGIGVDDNANPDAPNSLTGRPAREYRPAPQSFPGTRPV